MSIGGASPRICGDREQGLEARGIGRRPTGAEGWLLQDISISVRPGDRVAILGQSGAGKSLLLRALAMLDPLDVGTILWHGRAIEGDAVPSFRSQVIYLHQRPSLFEGSVEENLRLPLSLNVHRGLRFQPARVARYLEEIGWDGSFLVKSHRDLSGGEAQVVALVRALQLDPTILLLDEATSSLDRDTARAAESLLGRWHAEGDGARALVWVTHDPDQARRVAERRVIMQSGRLEPEP